MADSPCLRLIKESIEDFNGQEMNEILEDLRSRQVRFRREGLSATEAAKQASEELSGVLRTAAKIEKRNAAINRRIRLEHMDRLNTVWEDDPVEGILSIIYGSPKSRQGSRNSVHAAQAANFRRLIGGVQHELDAAGVFDVLRRGEMDLDVTRALWNINDNDALARLPSSAVEVARILNKWREVARKDSNRFGAWIGFLKNYVVRQTHNPQRVLSAGFEKWKEFILPRLDMERMFPEGPPDNLNQWLDEAFANITTGIRIRNKMDKTAERMAAFKGPANLAKKVSQDRTFHFKSPEDWFEYNKEFGAGTLREAYVNDLHRRAESMGLIQVLGTNPEYNLDAIVRALRIQLSRRNPDLLAKFDKGTRSGRRIDNAFKEVSGFTRTVANPTIANVGAFIRMWNAITKLGKSVLISMTDIGTRASLLRFQGRNFLGAIGEGVVAPIKRMALGLGSPERRALLHAAGYFNDVALRNIVSRFSPDENVPGKIHAVTHQYFKWNLLGPWTDTMRGSSIEAMARFHGELGDTSWDQLMPRTQRSLERFDITAKEWEVLRRGSVADESGARFLSPQAVRELPLDDFVDLASKRIDSVKRGLLARVKRRMKQDIREREWAEKREVKFKKDLQKQSARLQSWISKKKQDVLNRRDLLRGRIADEVTMAERRAMNQAQRLEEQLVDKVMKANQRLHEISIDLENVVEWWQYFFDMDVAPEYGKRLIRSAGTFEGTLRAKQRQTKQQWRSAVSDFRRKMKAMDQDLADLEPELKEMAGLEVDKLRAQRHQEIIQRQKEFNEGWAKKQEELHDFFKRMDERIKQREAATAGELDQLEGKDLVTKLGELGDQQRGTPERAMLKAQSKIGGGVLNPVVEHTGDLIHRMSHHAKYDTAYPDIIIEKTTKILGFLKNKYGFVREMNENFASNAKVKGVSVEEYRAEVDVALKEYTDAHRALPTYNRPTKLANDAAIAVGEKRFHDAIDILEELDRLARNPEAFNKEALSFDKQFASVDPNNLDKFGGTIQRILESVREETADKMQRLYADDVDSAVITPDARTQAFVHQGQQAGTPMGDALRVFWNVRTFSIGIMQRGFMREFYGYEKGRGGAFGTSEMRGLALFMLAGLGFGYAGMTLRDLISGRTRRPLNRVSTWIEAMVQGGTLGMYGDFLLGNQSKYGTGFMAALGGPTVGTLDEVYQLYGAVQELRDPRAQALKLAINNVPYNNLFYTRTAIDYLFLYEMQEAMNPGYLRRYEKRVEEQTGSEFWLRPTEAAR